MTDRLILASGSPRRAEIISRLGIDFSIHPQDVDESFSSENLESEAVRLAGKKVRACIKDPEVDPDSWILGADTFIECSGIFIGKPADRTEAREMLQLLSGKTHTVITGLALNLPRRAGVNINRIETAFCRTAVTFSPIDPLEIEWYLDQEEWKGAAAAYRIQQKGAVFVASISGSYSNVMGLPINTFYGMLTANNFNFRN